MINHLISKGMFVPRSSPSGVMSNLEMEEVHIDTLFLSFITWDHLGVPVLQYSLSLP